MAKPNTFTDSAELILASFATLTVDRKVFRARELARLLQTHMASWNLGEAATTSQVLEFLTSRRVLQTIRLASESGYAPLERFATPDASPFEVALSIRGNSYLCHSTAVFLHGLTDQLPQTIYVNAEQGEKPRPSGVLTQESIDRAFRSHQRSSRYVFVHERNRFAILSGKHTSGYGVITVSSSSGETLRTTDLERTLVDITVRPTYGGGVHQVLAAFRSAVDKVSSSRLLATLRALDYVYPYHQALGFYLERAGVPPKHLDEFRMLGLAFDFYLAHGLTHPAYDPSWRIYFPKGL